MFRRRAFRRLTALACCMFLIANFTSCFSERGTDIGGLPDGDACSVPASALVGSRKAVIAIYKYAFFPDTLRISAGTEVTWVNCDPSAGTLDKHTSTSDTPGWDSGLFGEGESYKRTFSGGGSFPYHCTPHPAMKGVVIVQ
jgi:plastocyanin